MKQAEKERLQGELANLQIAKCENNWRDLENYYEENELGKKNIL